MPVGRNNLCPCGSGLKFKHCHGATTESLSATMDTAVLFRAAQQLLNAGDLAKAIEHYRKILRLNPEHADARHYLGVALCFEGRRRDGLEHIRASLALKPNDSMYHHNYALSLEAEGDLNGAEMHFVRALELCPGHRDARISLAELLLRRRRNHAARQILTNACRQHPADIELGCLYAEALFRLGELSAMQEQFRILLEVAPEDIDLRLRYAEKLQATGKDDAALSECQFVLVRAPHDLRAMRLCAFIEERRNRLDAARHWAELMLEKSPGDATTRRLMARVYRRRGQADAALQLLDGVDTASLSLTDKAHHHMERGMVLDKLQRYDEAFAAFREGNDAARLHIEQESSAPFYDREQIRQQFDALRQFFVPDLVAQLAQHAPPARWPAPLFIVGFPRSGTTLIEQMLAAHPHIYAGDELNALHMLEVSAAVRLGSVEPYPACLERVLANDGQRGLREMRDAYISLAYQTGALAGADRWFTDKMPLNETRLGLIRLLFPDSPVIHVVRHPLDVVLSCYMNELFHGSNCALQLETAAFHYAAVLELVEQQVGVLGLHYVRVRYEDLLEEPERELRRLLEFVGEPWDPHCLEFHRSMRVSRTASYAQVAQPLYRSAAGRWRHYRVHLEGIIPLLKPAMHKLGYLND